MNLTVIYYTSNWLDEKNPYFLSNTKKQLLKATDGLPIISVSQKPIDLGQNICLGDIGRSHLNIYKQILIGCRAATTEYVAMAEDDILYSYEHFHSQLPQGDVFLYDMQKWSLFTWSKPPIFSFRMKRRVVNHLIAPRKMLIDALEERFARVEVLKREIPLKHPEITDPASRIIKYWGDPGRYENLLGVTVRESDEFFSKCPSIVFSHEYAYGYEFNQGKKKRLGDIHALEVPVWGRASDVMKLYHE